METILSVEEAAVVLGLSVPRVRRFVQTGRLKPDKRVGHVQLFRRETVEAFAAIPRVPGYRLGQVPPEKLAAL